MSARIQENGRVTIPAAIRKKYRLRKGSLVAFVETEGGVLMKPPEIIFTEALQEIGEALKAEGIT
ncbi:MAG: AbrB/MazE/SpoVT family DNA-binding domain-containing protein, partial [Nanoarchaeota archaeon]|nr:AbrB/MazE/SpoVT family DNA-binding domain-containing protein [Nanoarchaeota archaeon]